MAPPKPIRGHRANPSTGLHPSHSREQNPGLHLTAQNKHLNSHSREQNPGLRPRASNLPRWCVHHLVEFRSGLQYKKNHPKLRANDDVVARSTEVEY